MTKEKADRIRFLRCGPRVHTWRRIAEIICDEFPDESQNLRGNQLHGVDLCKDAMMFLLKVDDIHEVSVEERDRWDT